MSGRHEPKRPSKNSWTIPIAFPLSTSSIRAISVIGNIGRKCDSEPYWSTLASMLRHVTHSTLAESSRHSLEWMQRFAVTEMYYSRGSIWSTPRSTIVISILGTFPSAPARY